MPTTKPRGTVVITPEIEQAFRAKVAREYPDIPDILNVPLARLIRFYLMVTVGYKPEIAKRGLNAHTRRGFDWDSP